MTSDTPRAPRDAALAECQKLFDHFDTRASKYKRTFQWYKHLSISLSIAVTVLSALDVAYGKSLLWAWLLPFTSGLVTFSTAMLHASNAHELWLRARSMTHKLETERFLFLQAAGPYDADHDQNIRLFSERIMAVWAEGHTNWEKATERMQDGA
jgi:hypothetical protein